MNKLKHIPGIVLIVKKEILKYEHAKKENYKF